MIDASVLLRKDRARPGGRALVKGLGSGGGGHFDMKNGVNSNRCQ